MTIKIEAVLMVEKEMPKKIETFGDNCDALSLLLWNQEESKDFTIIAANGEEVTAHKNVLAVRSPVFARMFESDLKEAKENKVEIKDFSIEIVEAAIKLCYHYSLVTYVTFNDKMTLLQFFDKYDIQLLKKDLESNLISEIDESNCTEFLRDCLQEAKPVCDIDILDKDFVSYLINSAFCHVLE
uniref:BTB domain-containing protein n=1 Tax=Panagrolaimus superbus TaxID=310955 RepID=A0A914XYB9_9BILA